MIRARRRATESTWAGFGFFGLVGWSIVLPTLIGIAIGRWLDRSHPGERSWTLALLIAGLSLGCLNTWRWIQGEHGRMEAENKDNNPEHHE